MPRRYEAEDATGAKMWLEEGVEVYEQGDRFRACLDPGRTDTDEAWAPGSFASVDEAFMAARLLKQMGTQGGD